MTQTLDPPSKGYIPFATNAISAGTSLAPFTAEPPWPVAVRRPFFAGLGLQIRFLKGLAEPSEACARLDRHQQRFAGLAVPAEADGRAHGWGGRERASSTAILLLDPGHHIAVTEVGLEIWIGV